MPYAYGVDDQAFSSDYYNFYLPLKEMSEEIILFDYYKTIKEAGKTRMNELLLEQVKKHKPDLVFVVLHTDEFIPEIMEKIKGLTVSLGFFHDDVWRQAYANYWAQYFTCILSTDPFAEEHYQIKGIKNALPFPQACNENIYKYEQLPKKYDVSFVGAYHPYRAWLIQLLRKSGVEVKIFGAGWERARLLPYLRGKISNKTKNEQLISQEGMIEIFNQSKINLNLPNSTSWDARYLASSPLALLNTWRSQKYRDGIKLRLFEISACRGFQLSYYEEGLEKYFEIGKELAIFLNPDDLVNKVQYFLKNDKERELIAQRGQARTLREHTMLRRMKAFLARG